jgi:hypothetical protein
MLAYVGTLLVACWVLLREQDLNPLRLRVEAKIRGEI